MRALAGTGYVANYVCLKYYILYKTVFSGVACHQVWVRFGAGWQEKNKKRLETGINEGNKREFHGPVFDQ